MLMSWPVVNVAPVVWLTSVSVKLAGAAQVTVPVSTSPAWIAMSMVTG